MTGRVAFHSVTAHRLLSTFAFSVLLPCICHRLFSLLSFLLSLFEDFLSLHFLCYALNNNKKNAPTLSCICSSFLTFYFTFLPLHLSFGSLSLFLSLRHFRLNLFCLLHSIHASDACVEKLVARLKKHLGEFSASCACMRAHNGACCLFNATYIPQLPPQWPILCGSCSVVTEYSIWQNIQNIKSSASQYVQYMRRRRRKALLLLYLVLVTASLSSFLYAPTLLINVYCNSHYRNPHPAYPQSVLHYYCIIFSVNTALQLPVQPQVELL